MGMVLGVVLGAVREVVQGLVQGVVEEVILGVDTIYILVLLYPLRPRGPPRPPEA